MVDRDNGITVEVDPLTVNVEGVMTITIPFDMYNELLQIKGRYEEIKDGEKESEDMMREYKELLVIKGKYEELSAMFDAQFDITDTHDIQTPMMSSKLTVDDEVTCTTVEFDKPICSEEAMENCCEAVEESHTPGPDDNNNGNCRGM